MTHRADASTAWSGSSRLSRRPIRKTTSPRSVNLQAFESRFLQDLLQPLAVGLETGREAPRPAAPGSRAPSARRPGRKLRSTKSRKAWSCTGPALTAIVPDSIFDEVEDVVDQLEQVGARRSRWSRANSTCSWREVPVRVVGESLREDQQAVERRAQLVGHVGEELRLVLGGERELLGLLLQRALGAAPPRRSCARPRSSAPRGGCALLLLQLLVGRDCSSSVRPGTAAERLGPHVGGDGVEHDADALGQLLQERRGGRR